MTWDGDGIDPWLPTRLRHAAGIAAAERQVYDSYWARLSAWLVDVARRVLAGGTPDPVAVYATAPAWAASMADFVDTTIRAVMDDAYRTVLGPGDYDSRPAVATHLATVNNRMVRTPDEVFTLVAREVAEAAGEGESIPDTAQRIQDVLDVTENEDWRNRATVVARTETMGALNAGRTDAFGQVAEDLGGEWERIWLATDDVRTRETHRAADGQRRPLKSPFSVGGWSLMFPGDPTGPPHEIIQCRCVTVLVGRGESIDLSNRQTRGD